VTHAGLAPKKQAARGKEGEWGGEMGDGERWGEGGREWAGGFQMDFGVKRSVVGCGRGAWMGERIKPTVKTY
jgi:hypothetical protein